MILGVSGTLGEDVFTGELVEQLVSLWVGGLQTLLCH